jgi:hypothetical protein
VTIICCSQARLIRERFLQRTLGVPPFGMKHADQNVKKHDLFPPFSPFLLLQTVEVQDSKYLRHTRNFVKSTEVFVMAIVIFLVVKRQSSPVTGLEWPRGFQEVKVVSLTHRPPLPPGNAPGTHFC